jgi:hypothetical protein
LRYQRPTLPTIEDAVLMHLQWRQTMNGFTAQSLGKVGGQISHFESLWVKTARITAVPPIIFETQDYRI